MLLKDRVAIITGGNSGIGRCTALLFAHEGAKIVIADWKTDARDEILSEIRALGLNAEFIQCDVRIVADCQRVIDITLKMFGRIDILFNNAGIVPFGRAEDTDEATWDNVMDINAKGVFLMSRIAIPIMRNQGGGIIINTASDAGIVGCKRSVAYCASKGAVVLMTKAMAVDHAKENIRINAVCPGDTYVKRWDERATQEGSDLAEYIASASASAPMGRVADVNEIASTVLFLASDASSFMTGATLIVDGGFTAG